MKKAGPIVTVSELTRRIKSVLEFDFADVSVQGEISNCKQHSSGHLYFTMKDEGAQVQAVMWRSRVTNLFFTPQDGMKVVARGRITVYEPRGNYQIDITQLQPLGVGELQLAFERLKQKLAAEGLFDEEHKKPLPTYPKRIGVVTSPTGAAIRDIINIISRRFPAVEVIVNPVNVQGVGAAKEIAQAISDFNMLRNIDVMIVGRGGGSLEDLWAFNEEIVARAIYQSRIPIISAVGHEIDFTISDFVADLRAPTPSAAAELVVPQIGDLVEILRNFCYTSEQLVRTRLASEKDTVTALLRSYAFNRPVDLVRQFSQQLDELQRAMTQATTHRFTLLRERYTSFQKRIASVNPRVVLGRGYAIIWREGKAVSNAMHLHPSDSVDVELQDGKVPAEIQ